jgi:hypothetical protein
MPTTRNEIPATVSALPAMATGIPQVLQEAEYFDRMAGVSR